MDVHARRPLIEERRRPLGRVGHVLHQDHRHTPGPGRGHRRQGALQHRLRLPQGKGAAGEIVVLQVDDDQGGFAVAHGNLLEWGAMGRLLASPGTTGSGPNDNFR